MTNEEMNKTLYRLSEYTCKLYRPIYDGMWTVELQQIGVEATFDCINLMLDRIEQLESKNK